MSVEHVAAPGPKLLEIDLHGQQIKAAHAERAVFGQEITACNGCGKEHRFGAVIFIGADGTAIYSSLNALQARNYATDLLELANALDGGKAHH